MKKQNWIRVCTILVMVFMLFCIADLQDIVLAEGNSEPSAEERLNQLNQELNDLNTQIKQLEQNIADGKAGAEDAQLRQSYYAQQAALLEEQIVLKKQEIQLQEQAIADKQEEIVQKQNEFDENDKLFRQRLVAIYKMNDATMLSTLLTVDSFADLTALAKNMQHISKHDLKLLEDLEAQRLDLEQSKSDMQLLLDALELERQSLDNDLKEYQNSITQAQIEESGYIAQVQQEEQNLSAAYAAKEEAQKELEDVWSSLKNDGERPYVGGALEWPVPSHNGDQYISSSFGWRTLYGRPDFHTGIDIARGPSASIQGSSIVAANAGTVVKVVTGSNIGYGNYVIVDHGGGIKTLYAHCNTVTVSVGATVARGSPVATVGNTGNSTGPHLHFELRLNHTEKVDPYPYLTGAKSL